MSESQKTVIMSTGDKGGAGKSTTARLIGEILCGNEAIKERPLICADGDTANPDLITAFLGRPGIESMGFSPSKTEDINTLVEKIFTAPEDAVILLDMPAGAGEHIQEESDMFQAIFSQPDINVHMVWTLNTGAPGVRQLHRMAEVFEGVPVKWTVVKNLFYSNNNPDAFPHFEQSEVKNKLAKTEGGLTVTNMKSMDDKSLKALANHSFSDAAANQIKEVPFYARVRAASFLKDARDSFKHLIPESAPAPKNAKKGE